MRPEPKNAARYVTTQARGDELVLTLGDLWRASTLGVLEPELAALEFATFRRLHIDARQIVPDLAGAWVLRELERRARAAGLEVSYEASRPATLALIDATLAEKLGLGRARDLVTVIAPLTTSPLRVDEAVAFEGAPSIELHHRSGVTGLGFFVTKRDDDIDINDLGPLSVASGAGRPALVALGAARDAVRGEYLVIAPTAADAIRLQVAGVRGAIAPAGALDLSTAQLIASLVPAVILAVASGTPTDEATATLTLLARAGLQIGRAHV